MSTPSFFEALSSSSKNPLGTLQDIGRFGSGLIHRGEIAFALGLIAILVVLIMPLPKSLLDISLAISLTFSVMILMTVLFIGKPLDFSSFPTVLLVATMLRLALNVASTRLILANGHEGTHAAGEVICAFGHFVMGGNFVIGMIVFSILVIINFVVITKGSSRIAEVAARFSLDALPGKQMSVDADLSSGVIDQNEARKRRQIIQDETNFYGAMDGAAKFVRGDAIAGLLITLINIFGGIIIGVVQQSLSFSQAAKTYTVLTVGDGLVAQVPALIISVAAGMLVSKTAVDGSTDKALFGQLGAYPMALGMSSFLMGTMALLPGIPSLPFASLAFATGIAAWKLGAQQEKEHKISLEDQTLSSPTSTGSSEETLSASLHIEGIRLELGYGLLSLTANDKLINKIKLLRLEIARQMGFIIPSVRITDNLDLDAEQYRIRIKDIDMAKGVVRPELLLVMDPQGRPLEITGESTTEPIFGLPARWITTDLRVDAEIEGYTVVDAATVMTTHLTEVIKESMADLLSFSDVQKLIDELDKAHQKLFNDIVPTQLSPATFQRVLQTLLSEQISIRDLALILESVSDACQTTRNPTLLAEYVRSRLSRQLCATYQNKEGFLQIISLSSLWEKTFQDSLTGDSDLKNLIMAPSKTQEFVQKVKQVFEEHLKKGEKPILLTSSFLRPYVRSVIERFRPQTVVLSQNEIHPKMLIQTIGEI